MKFWRNIALALIAVARLTPAASTFTGAGVCAQCHADTHKEWSSARHGKMLQTATAASVKGDFSQRRIVLRGSAYRLREDKGIYYIAESTLSGKEQEYRVQYTLGSRRIQHYLTTLTDGRIVVLAPSWDVLRKQWFHNLDIVDPEETDSERISGSGAIVQVWNKNCYSCHVSREEKNFDTAQNTYSTRWQDFGTNCERCHGPGAEHAARHQGTESTKEPDGKTDGIVVPARLDARRSTMICAQCHSLRDMVSEEYTAGADYFDYFLPILEYGQKSSADPAYWPDGRTRRFSNDAIGLWQSTCFLKGGVTCLNCHSDVHDPEIEKNKAVRPGANGICTGCHAAIAQNISAHTHHASDSAGSACVECHMPRTVFSIKASIRDHSISIPVPENTTNYGIPNACNICHQNRDPNWTISKMDAWYGSRSRQKWIRRARAFTQARAGNAQAIGALLAILEDSAEGPVVRANAVGHLSRFSENPEALAGVERALTDQEALVRAVAAVRIESKNGQVKAALVSALSDPVRSVRVGAVFSLVSLGLPVLSDDDIPRFEHAKKEYQMRAQIQPDDAPEQLNVGKFDLLAGDPAAAIRALKNSLRLDPAIPAGYPLGYAYAISGQREDAVRTLRAISSEDPDFAAAQRLLTGLNRGPN